MAATARRASALAGLLSGRRPRGLVTASSPKTIRRFYKETSAGEHGDFWRVFLDGKPVKTPRGTFLELPTRPLAQAVAQEWGAQGEKLKPKEMPLTTIGCTAADLIRPEKASCVERIMPYLAMDTVCFEDEKEELAELQGKEWAPLRAWFEGRYGVQLAIGRGLEGPPHPEATLPTVSLALESCDEWELTALEIATASAKSLVVASALMHREDVRAKDALRWSLLEEHFQIERWGLVEGEHDVSHSESVMWYAACRRFGRLGRELAPDAE